MGIERNRHVDGAAAEEISGHVPACAGVTETLSRLGDKWSIVVVLLLRLGTRRFGQLKRTLPGISQRMLTLTLRNLERDGLVARTAHATVPPRVDYELTALGHSMSEPVEALGAWAIANENAIRVARRAFDDRNQEPTANELLV